MSIPSPEKFLVVHRDASIAHCWNVALTREGYNTQHIQERSGVLLWLREEPIDVLLLEHFFPLTTTLDWVQRIKHEQPDIEILLLASDWSYDEQWVALKWGIAECLNVTVLEGDEARYACTLHRIRRIVHHRRHLHASKPSFDPTYPFMTFREAKQKAVSHFEYNYLQSVCERAQGNISQAARLSGMDRTNFRRLLKKNDLIQ